MKTAYTPGPWRLILQDNVIEAPNGGRLIDIIPRSLCVPKEERDANAALIAAAPELLEALRRLIVIVRDSRADGGPAWTENDASAFVAAQAAIDKATAGNP